MKLSTKRLVFSILVVILGILASLVYWQVFLGSGEEAIEEAIDEQCKTPYMRGEAYISHDSSIASLGDVLKMHVEIRFCTDRIVADRDSFNSMLVTPFDLRTRSITRERRDGVYTIWEADYEIQPLNVSAGRSYKLLFAGIDYEDNGLLAHMRINSNEIYIGSFVSGIRENRPNRGIGKNDILGITKHNIKEETRINRNSVLLIIAGGLLIIFVFAFAFKKIPEYIRIKNVQDSDIDYAASFKSSFDSTKSPDDLQALYFSLRALEETHKDDERLKSAIDVANESFDPQGDMDEIKERLWHLVEPFAVELVNMGRPSNGVD